MILLICLLVVGFGVPRVMTLVYQTKAGSILDGVIPLGSDQDMDYFACLLPVLFEMPEGSGEDVAEAIRLFEQSLSIIPNNDHAYYLMGQSLCLNREFDQAIDYLEKYIEQCPKNPLGWMEKGFAYFSMAESLDGDQDEMKASYLNAAILSLEEAGITGGLLKNHADIAFEEGDYRIAWVYYRLSNAMNLLSDADCFKIAMLDLVMQGETEQWDYFEDELILTLEDSLTIQPSSFFRLEDGELVYVSDMQGEMAGMYYRNKDPGGSMIWVEESGNYYVSINALDHPPAPTNIQVSLDFDPLVLLELKNGDDDWIMYEARISLVRGYHLLHVRLTNDGKVNGVDRNAYMGLFQLSQSE